MLWCVDFFPISNGCNILWTEQFLFMKNVIQFLEYIQFSYSSLLYKYKDIVTDKSVCRTQKKKNQNKTLKSIGKHWRNLKIKHLMWQFFLVSIATRGLIFLYFLWFKHDKPKMFYQFPLKVTLCCSPMSNKW